MEEEIKMKVASLCQSKYSGDYQKLFDSYNTAKNGKLCSDEIMKILEDAGVGYRFTRPIILYSIVQVLDTNHDGFVTFDEFKAELK
jgi:Ca2+-binding EF-hand superfamily protein